jgi:hypothetical protein
MIVTGINNKIPINPNKVPPINIDSIDMNGDILLLSLYILGVIKYASILGNTNIIIDVRINRSLLTTDAVISAITPVIRVPTIGINEVIELSIPSNKKLGCPIK